MRWSPFVGLAIQIWRLSLELFSISMKHCSYLYWSCFLVPLFCIPVNASPQSSSEPVFEYVDIAYVLWQDSLQRRKLDRVWGGVDSISNVQTDSGLVRYDFDEWGQWVHRVRIVQVEWNDTAYTENLSTGDMEMEVTKGTGDIPNGYFQEYRRSNYPIRAGMVEMGKPVGLWRYFGERGIVIKTINIGRYGWPEGECVEYHLNGAKHWEGAYGIRTMNGLECPGCRPGVPWYGKRVERSLSVPVGEWKEWDDSGKLIQVVTYARKED